ncbi:MAG: hypothetical protein R3283_11530 [Balneolaceae bacterium]|nr:hypothetical protein [Balneolaceae bacterium]
MNSQQGKKLNKQSIMAMSVTAIGFVLLVYMVLFEDEPGAIPLLMIASGIGWIAFNRVRTSRSLKEN